MSVAIEGQVPSATLSRSKTPKVRRSKKKDDGKENGLDTIVDEKDRGSGVYIFKNGAAKYDGEWERVEGILKRHGKGIYSESDEKYEGEWKDDKMWGHGKYTFASGAIYEGEWFDGKFQGKGKYTFPNGTYFEGMWADNKMNGQGVYHAYDQQFKGKFTGIV